MYKHDVEQLVANPAWQEIVETLEETRKGLIDDLCELDPATEAGRIARQQGRLKMIDFVLVLPKSFIEEIESEAKKKQTEEETEDGT